MNNRTSIADLSPSVQRQVLEQIRAQRFAVAAGTENPYPVRKSKYNNKKCEIDGYKFDSLREADHYLALKAALHNGSISNLEIHPRFKLIVNGIKIGTYIADFAFVAYGSRHIHDVKGVKTALYKLKKKLMLACHGVEVKEI